MPPFLMYHDCEGHIPLKGGVSRVLYEKTIGYKKIEIVLADTLAVRLDPIGTG